MKLYDLWSEYEKNPNDVEISKLFCQRVRTFARKVLSKFRINNPTLSYEDLLQQAYVCFFETAPAYDPSKGSLEGFFLLSFRRHIIALLQGLPYSVPYKDKEDDAPSPLDILIANEFDKEIESLLSASESKLYNSYLKEGVTNYKEIASEEGADVNEVKWIVDSIGDKLRQYLNNKYNFYKERDND